MKPPGNKPPNARLAGSALWSLGLCLLLGAWLALSPGVLGAGSSPAAPEVEDPWQAVRAASGDEQAKLLVGVLQDPSVPLEAANLELAWQLGLAQARLLNFELALPIQQALYQRSGADWAASNLALSLQRLGRYAEAAVVLDNAIEACSAPQLRAAQRMLLDQRALLALGSGDEALARNLYGSGLARGSVDAGAVLGRLELSAGRALRARTLFRPGLVSDPPNSWSLRGWGASFLENPALPRPLDAFPATTPSSFARKPQ